MILLTIPLSFRCATMLNASKHILSRVVLQKEARRNALLIPKISGEEIVFDDSSQYTSNQFSQSEIKGNEHQLKSVKRSFLSRKRGGGEEQKVDKPRNFGIKVCYISFLN